MGLIIADEANVLSLANASAVRISSRMFGLYLPSHLDTVTIDL